MRNRSIILSVASVALLTLVTAYGFLSNQKTSRPGGSNYFANSPIDSQASPENAASKPLPLKFSCVGEADSAKREACYKLVYKALNSNQAADCEALSDATDRQLCHNSHLTLTAAKSGDMSICSQIRTEIEKNGCINQVARHLAIKSGEKSWCDKTLTDAIKNECLAALVKSSQK